MKKLQVVSLSRGERRSKQFTLANLIFVVSLACQHFLLKGSERTYTMLQECRIFVTVATM